MTGRVTILEGGREGSVRYGEGARAIEGYWTFGGGDVVAIVSMGAREHWQRAHPWALERRAAILRRVADEVIRQRAPTCTAEIDDAGGDILLRQSGSAARGASATAAGGPAPPDAPARAVRFVREHARLRSMTGLWLLVAALVVGGVLSLGRKLLLVAPASGVPLNASVRTATHIASLIQYTDPHLPRVTGRGGDDTTSVAVLMIPLDGAAPRVVPVIGKLSGSSYGLARILGSDGHTLWLDVTGLFGVRLADHALVTPERLREANPDLPARWWEDSRGMDVIDGRLHLTNADRSAAIDLDPASLRATPARPKVDRSRFDRIEPADYLAAGFLDDSGTWFGLHSPEELQRDFGPGEWVRPVENAAGARQARRLFRGTTEPSSDGTLRRILDMTPLGPTEFLNAAFLRMNAQSPPLRLAAPDGALLIYTSAPGQQGTLVVARVDLAGKVVWSADTGLDRFLLQQILPGDDAFAFVGTRPPIPDKLSEPLVVLVDNATGRLARHSLWRAVP